MITQEKHEKLKNQDPIAPTSENAKKEKEIAKYKKEKGILHFFRGGNRMVVWSKREKKEKRCLERTRLGIRARSKGISKSQKKKK